jgi:hypothetical protein
VSVEPVLHSLRHSCSGATATENTKNSENPATKGKEKKYENMKKLIENDKKANQEKKGENEKE